MRSRVGMIPTLALLALLTVPSSAFAFRSGFPFNPDPEEIAAIELPAPATFRLCPHTIQMGELSIFVFAPCSATPPPAPAPTLTLVKTVVNDNGGTATASDFTARIDGADVSWGVAHTVTVGSHAASEVALDGYDGSSWGGDCAADGSITLAAGENKTCTITNDDQQGYIVISKELTNDDGGTMAITDFSFTIDGGLPISFTSNQMIVPVDAGVHTVVEVTASGYTTTYENNQNANANCNDLAVKNGNPPQPLPDVATCLIKNNDNASPPEEPTLSFSADRVVVHEGSASEATTTLTWDSTNVTACDASGAAEWTGSKAAAGTEIVTPTADVTYTLHCMGDGGDVQQQVSIDFVPAGDTGALLISEVLYDIGDGQGEEIDNEWVELWNGTSEDIDLTGYALKDNSGTVGDVFPQGTIIQAGEFLVVVASSTTEGFWSIPAGVAIVLVDGDIGGNGLANVGDRVALHDAQDTVIDSVSWGTDVTAFDPSVNPTTSDDFPGSSIARSDNTVDTNTAADWQEDQTPTPGQ